MNTLEEIIKIRINNFNIEHFTSLGYNVIPNEYIEIFVYELPNGSGTKVNVECNYCRKIFKKAYRRFLETQDDICCEDCKQKKMMKISLRKYGNICSLRNKNVLEKSKKTNRENLGVDFPFQNKSILEKCVKSSINKHGDKYRFNSISKQQRYFQKIYGGLLNFSVFPFFLDLYFEDYNVYFEYDGSGHNLGVKLGRYSEDEFYKKEHDRSLFLSKLGYKEFRILSDTDMLPTEEILLEIKNRAIYYLVEQNFNKYIYDLNTNTESFEN